MLMAKTVKNNVEAAIDKVLKKFMGRRGYVRSVVSPGEDQYGDEVLFIHAEYKYLEDPIDVYATVG